MPAAHERPPSPGPDEPDHAPTLAERLMSRRVVLAGAAAGVGAIGVTGALLTRGGGTTTAEPSAPATTTRPTTSSARTTRPTTATTTTSAPPTTTATTSAATTTTAATSSATRPPSTSSAPPAPPPPTSTTKPPTSTTPPPPPPPPGEFLANTADVPLKGGLILDTDNHTVVTHPSSPTFCAFTAICTHQGCIVEQVARNTITCFCHGSQYDAATGEVIAPPAPEPLARKSIVVQDGKIYLV